MPALKNFKHDQDEDGELPCLITGEEENLKELLSNVKVDGGVNMVSTDKVSRVNFQQENEELESINESFKIPVTIITGYLGSGKSTLLEMIALKGSDKKIAVILNEFGESSEIEKAMTIRNGSAAYEEWLDLGNGCLCCSLQNIGVKAIENMIKRSPGKIDYILLETSGIADPAPIAKMFWQDEGLNSSVYIDGIITVLDSEHILRCLEDSPDSQWHGENVAAGDGLTIAHFQLAMADRILINKFDKIEHDSGRIKLLEDKVRSINAEAPIFFTKYGELGLDNLLDLHAYDSKDVLSLQLKTKPAIHDHRMTTVTLDFRPLTDKNEYETFMRKFIQPLLWKSFGASQESLFRSGRMQEDNWEIQRTKGLILIHSDDTKRFDVKILQGVRDTYDVFPGELSPKMTSCKLVLIGKYLGKEDLESLLKESIK
ncbi:hypothetical protein HG535_0A07410 [Zygotorulaspora mrakii]|uniref:CobW/HypB/UreG nucleotide-binding domain-containing protein n=1 Tax=Zygotorulaspora mrakii TaxID=42260 RepID=A0A7H9AYE9_ZYGMR|nr:uncharacterized protein HG535_0A07410 [Zygotorulaspora mrakii]QLG70799.1 hypothetical protein HG535_0A07410 [Zygotorulaspora mrakii]